MIGSLLQMVWLSCQRMNFSSLQGKDVIHNIENTAIFQADGELQLIWSSIIEQLPAPIDSFSWAREKTSNDTRYK